MPHDTSVQDWLDDFFHAYHRHRPVNATFVGVHEHDHRLPAASESGLGDRLASIESLLDRAPAARDTPPRGSPREEAAAAVESVDLRLARGFLELQRWECRSGHFMRGNPSWYTGEAVFGALSLFLSDFAPLHERAAAAAERLEAVPDFLYAGLARLRSGPGVPPAWRDRAVRECAGGLAFCQEGIPHLIRDLERGDPGGRWPRSPTLAASLRSASETAAAGFHDFREILQGEGAPPGREAVGCGAEVLDLHLREAHALDRSAEEIAEYARDELARLQGTLPGEAKALGFPSLEAALESLRRNHPTPPRYLERYRELWEECRAVAEEEALVTWPDFPIRYVPRPPWARAAAPHLYFLFYRSPAAYRRPPVHEYLVAPLPEGPDGGPASAETTLAFLRNHHDYVLKTNHVIHHGGLGHHVQNHRAFHGPSRVGRIAAVDCAARIAMHCGGTMAEGWACYATDLMAEIGALTPVERLAEKASRIRMCCRAVVDVELHRGSLSLEGAAALYRNQAGMSPAAAWNEAVKNSMFPGGALMYLVGTDHIHSLRREVEAALGAAFRPRRFHDRFLAHGSIPVTLAGELLKAELGLGGSPGPAAPSFQPTE